MNRMASFSLFFLATLICKATVQDTSRYFVYFKDKIGIGYPYIIGNPIDFLTQKAIDRRLKQKINIDESDLPVNPTYIEKLREEGIEVFFTSRWLNGVLIQADENSESLIASLSFVDSLRLIAKSKRLSFNRMETEIPTTFDSPISNNADSDIQLMMVGANAMHKDDLKGQGMLIAVLDNGYVGVNQFSPFQHLWENDQIIASMDFVGNSGNVFQYGSHGTSVLSIMASQFVTDSTNYFGVAYEANYILCVTEDNEAENTIEEYNWLIGAEFADSLGADVINSSLAYKTFDIPEHNYSTKDLDGNTAVVSIAATMAAKKGIIVVTSAGNSGRRTYPENLIIPPSDALGTLTVGSVESDFSRSNFSSIGPTIDGRIKPDVAAFGGATAIIKGNGEITRGSGTSFSSPIIAGLAACIWQANPDQTNHEVIESLKDSGHQAENPDSFLGYGVPNYLCTKEIKELNITDILNSKITVYPNPFKEGILFLLINDDFKFKMHIRMIDSKGTVIFNKSYEPHEISGRIEIAIDSIKQGIYFLSLQTETDQKIVKLINF